MILYEMFPLDVVSFLGFLSEVPQYCSMSILEMSLVYVLFLSNCELHHVLLLSTCVSDCVLNGCLSFLLIFDHCSTKQLTLLP